MTAEAKINWLNPEKGRSLEWQKFLVARALGGIITSTTAQYIPPEATVLEIGAGTGYGRQMMPDNFLGKYYSTDICIPNLKIGTFKYGVHAIGADATRLPFRSGAVDVVIAQDTLDILDNLPAGFAEFDRVLKPNGHIIHFTSVKPLVEGMTSKDSLTDLLNCFQDTLHMTSGKANFTTIESQIRNQGILGAKTPAQRQIGANTYIQAIGQTVAFFDEKLDEAFPGVAREQAMAYVFVAKKS